ncbi:MAG: hypothetical protein ACRBCT_00440 [Alphaproteobacteria bacterium]
MKDLVERIWPLPSAEKRKLLPSILYSMHLKKGLQASRDGDYLFYNAGAIFEKFCYAALTLCLLDVGFNLGFYVDLDLLEKNKMSFIGHWANIVMPIFILLFVLCYLRIRLTIDMKNDQIPFFMSKDFFRQRTKRENIGTVVFMVFIVCVVIPLAMPDSGFQDAANPSASSDWMHFNNNVFFVFAWQSTCLAAMPFMLIMGLSCALFLEKMIRFYPESQKDIENW